MKKMRVFAGKACCSMWPPSHSRVVYSPRPILAIIEQRRSNTVRWLYIRVFIMRSARTIATWASVAAVACSIFAFSWVGLALLGF
jgi:hypothetical protein